MRVGPFAENIRSLSPDNLVEVGIYMCSEVVPPVNLDEQSVQLIARLGARLDVDIILFGEETEQTT